MPLGAPRASSRRSGSGCSGSAVDDILITPRPADSSRCSGFQDYGTDGIRNTYDADGSEGDGKWQPGERILAVDSYLANSSDMATAALLRPAQRPALGVRRQRQVRAPEPPGHAVRRARHLVRRRPRRGAALHADGRGHDRHYGARPHHHLSLVEQRHARAGAADARHRRIVQLLSRRAPRAHLGDRHRLGLRGPPVRQPAQAGRGDRRRSAPVSSTGTRAPSRCAPGSTPRTSPSAPAIALQAYRRGLRRARSTASSPPTSPISRTTPTSTPPTWSRPRSPGSRRTAAASPDALRAALRSFGFSTPIPGRSSGTSPGPFHPVGDVRARRAGAGAGGRRAASGSASWPPSAR